MEGIVQPAVGDHALVITVVLVSKVLLISILVWRTLSSLFPHQVSTTTSSCIPQLMIFLVPTPVRATPAIIKYDNYNSRDMSDRGEYTRTVSVSSCDYPILLNTFLQGYPAGNLTPHFQYVMTREGPEDVVTHTATAKCELHAIR
jgi:hypothetical protein